MRKGDPPTFVGHSRLRSAKAEARRAPGLRSRSGCFGGVGKEGASADCAEEMKDTTGVSPWRLHVELNIRYDFVVRPSCVGCERGERINGWSG